MSFASAVETLASTGAQLNVDSARQAVFGLEINANHIRSKREGLVQSARDTLDATQYSYTTTANNIVLAAKQAYYGVLQANALLAVNEETVKDREVTLRQTQAFYDVGTKPKSDVTQAEANLYLAQANLIAARNNVDVAWAALRTAMGVDAFAKQPLAEQRDGVQLAFLSEREHISEPGKINPAIFSMIFGSMVPQPTRGRKEQILAA